VPMPYNKKLEAWTKPGATRVVEACKKVLYV
jgi:pyruvate/2-oxoglutarate/acetoin dehydrogenase E1 component